MGVIISNIQRKLDILPENWDELCTAARNDAFY
jgi:hypothetical protein